MMNVKSTRQKILSIVIGFLALNTGAAVSQENKTPQTVDFIPPSFALYTLSRSQGVPDSARQSLEQLRGILEQLRAQKQVIRIKEERIGLEGETRLCAEFASAEAAQKTWQQARQLTADRDLVDLKAEPCDRN